MNLAFDVLIFILFAGGLILIAAGVTEIFQAFRRFRNELRFSDAEWEAQKRTGQEFDHR